MADTFNFGGFLKATNKKREDAAEGNTSQDTKDTPADSQKAPEMSREDFLYGPEGMRRNKKKATPPASMKP